MAYCYSRVRKHCIYTWFFLNAGWLNLFGSVQTLEIKTEPEIFCDFLIGWFGFFSVRFFQLFFSGFFSLIGFFAHP
jgi:hypothetical protein